MEKEHVGGMLLKGLIVYVCMCEYFSMICTDGVRRMSGFHSLRSWSNGKRMGGKGTRWVCGYVDGLSRC